MANFLFKSNKNYRVYVKNSDQLKLLTDLFSTQISSRIRGNPTDENQTFKPLAKSTVHNYVYKLNRLSTLCQDIAWNGDISFLLDFNKLKECILNSGLESPKDYITPVVKILKYYQSDPGTIDKYQHLLSEFKIEETKKRGDNLASKKQEDTSLPLDEIVKRIDAFDPQDELQLIQKMLCAMYFLNTFTPRLEDIPLMKLANSKKKVGDMSKDYNYITTTGENGSLKVKDIIMNNYKTKHIYGQVRFPIDPNVAQLMNSYLQSYKKQNGDFFILNSKSEPYLIQTFAHLLENATKEVIGTPLNVNLIRRIKITAFYRQGDVTINQEDESAKSFLHSRPIHHEYLSVNLPK